jgi:O-antigen ligase
MTRPRAASPTIVALALVAVGALQFAVTLGVVSEQTGHTGLLVLGAVVLLYLMVTVDPAWLLSAGLVTTMFAGNWEEVGVNTPVPPHRILLLAGLVALMLRTNGRDRPRLQFRAVHFVLAGAVGYAVVSAIFADTIGRRSSQFILLDDFGVMPFLLFLVAPVAFATTRQRQILLGSLVAAGAYLAVTAVLEKLKLYDLVVPSYIGDRFVGTHFGRARGPFTEAAANGLALYACAIAAAMAVYLWREPSRRVIAAAIVILAPVGLLLTVTRSVWIAGIAGTAVALATTPELRRFMIPAAAAAASAVLIAFAVIPGLAAQAQERRQDKNPVYERENTTAAGLRMLADRPILGFGWARADDNIEPYFRQDPDIPLVGLNAGFHNLYLEYGVSLGLVGLGIWLVGGALAIHSAFAGRAPPSVRPWQIGLKAVLVAWLLVGLASPTKYSFITTVLWTWAGVASVRAQPAGGATTWSRSHGNPRSTSSA